eukprot:CAMPEP_0194283420 /NCGR_PEP_ID=MMETSP0169-20130528/25308_1 /TAXON_ID=218684 /ORGANISM="Corethron pennatum, Strain L29A3" /LENGTH=334 /DNA_ID=CAMNT_0039029017 /DNA_START=67 /DNA_END=1071 /DNA_ORIENTATION=+
MPYRTNKDNNNEPSSSYTGPYFLSQDFFSQEFQFHAASASAAEDAVTPITPTSPPKYIQKAVDEFILTVQAFNAAAGMPEYRDGGLPTPIGSGIGESEWVGESEGLEVVGKFLNGGVRCGVLMSCLDGAVPEGSADNSLERRQSQNLISFKDSSVLMNSILSFNIDQIKSSEIDYAANTTTEKNACDAGSSKLNFGVPHQTTNKCDGGEKTMPGSGATFISCESKITPLPVEPPLEARDETTEPHASNEPTIGTSGQERDGVPCAASRDAAFDIRGDDAATGNAAPSSKFYNHQQRVYSLYSDVSFVEGSCLSVPVDDHLYNAAPATAPADLRI